MSRVKRGVTAHARHKKVLKAASGFYGRRKNTIRTAKAAVDLVHKLHGELVGCAFLIELTFLPGRRVLQPTPVHALIQYAD